MFVYLDFGGLGILLRDRKGILLRVVLLETCYKGVID